MAVTVRIPTPLRPYVGDRREVAVAGATVGEVVQELVRSHEALGRHLLDEQGGVRSFVNLYLNATDVRALDGLGTTVRDGDVLVVVPAVAGGSDAARPVALSRDEVQQYSRHLIMPEVGLKGQERLKGARVLVVGAGGLGSPVALYLAAAGVGRIGLVDDDVVDATNLQRQVLYSRADVGRPKLKAAADRLQGLNPFVEVDLHETRFGRENALDLVGQYDVVVDGTDNFQTRYLANDAAVLSGVPNVYGSIFRFEGQASVFWASSPHARRTGRLGPAPADAPCYRCLYATPPPPGLVPSCAEGGVLGVLPGLVGVVQATETVKLLLGAGTPLLGRLLLVDALSMEFTELSLRKDPRCPLCGPDATQDGLVDYDAFCGVRGAEAPEATGDEIEPADLARRLGGGDAPVLVDVREPHEWDIARIEGSRLVPLGELPARAAEVPLDRDVVLVCLSGARSGRAAGFLRGLGHRRVRNLRGGLRAWADEVDPTMPRY